MTLHAIRELPVDGAVERDQPVSGARLQGFWPGAAAIFADVDSPIALAFLRRYPTPDSAARLGEKRLAAFLGQHQYCGRRTPAELLARLRASPAGLADEAEPDAKGEMVRVVAAILDTLVAQIARLTSRIRHAVATLPDGRIIMSFPRAGRICAAQSLTELGDVRERYLPPTSSRPRPPLSGHSPVRQEPWRHLSLGLLRILGRAWLRVLWRAWIDRQPYDPARPNAALTIPG